MGKAQNSASSIFTRYQLGKLKLKAIRAGVWFKALPRIDRVLVDLTIQVTENIRSAYLAKNIFAVVKKLEELLEGKFVRLTRTMGKAFAEKISMIAHRWGNIAAKSWSNDLSFARYLAVVMQAEK
jgi:hypothetical protein